MTVALPVLLGVAAALGGHLALAGLLLLAASVAEQMGGSTDFAAGAGLAMLVAPGLTQLLWVSPLAIVAFVRKAKHFLWGLLVAAGLVFLLNAGCWGLLGAGTIR